MTPPFDETKRQTLERLRAQKIKEYEAVIAQAGRALEASTRLRLQREADDLEEQIRQIELELAAIAKPDYAMGGDAEEITPTPRPIESPLSLADVLTITLEKGGRPYQAGPEQWWVRLEVESNQMVQECRGQIYDILELENEEDAVGEQLRAAQVTILSWADNNFNPISLDPNETYYLDLAWRATGDPPIPDSELRVASARAQGKRDTASPEWGRQQDFIPLQPGHYLLIVRFTAKDFARLERRFRLHWPGPGKEDEILLTAVNDTPDLKPATEQPSAHENNSPDLAAIAQKADELTEAVAAEENVPEPTVVSGPTGEIPKPIEHAESQGRLRQLPDDVQDSDILVERPEIETGTNSTLSSGDSLHTGVLDWIWGLIKHWLWVQFGAWIVLVIGVVSGANEIFDIPPCIRLGITTAGVLLGGGIIIAVSFHHKQRGNYHRRDRILTALLLAAATAVLMWFTIDRCTSIPLLPDPTPNPTVPATLTATITETATATPPTCGTPHPSLPGSGISGSITVTYTQSSNLSGCIVFREERPQFQVSWTDAPVGTELWLLVYSPQTQQYFPHYCVSIQVSRGGQMCQATLLREEPYEIVFVLANASAHAFLQANSSIDANNLPHGIGIEEKFSIQLVRTQ